MCTAYVDSLLREVLANLKEFSGAPSIDSEIPSSKIENAFRACPRHKFVSWFRQDSAEEGRVDSGMDIIYRDNVVGHDGPEVASGLTSNSKPSVNYWMMHQLDLVPGHRVLEIGAGGGWLIAMIGRIVGPTGTVLGVEVDGELVRDAQQNLLRNGSRNVTVTHSNGLESIASHDQFDRIVITTGISHVPYFLVERLAEGGSLVAPIAMRTGADVLFAFDKLGRRLRSRALLPTVFVPARDLSGQHLLDRARRVELNSLKVYREAQSRQVRSESVCELLDRNDLSTKPSFGSFRWFLAIRDPDFIDFSSGESQMFGLLGPDATGVAIYDGNNLIGVGDLGPFEKLRMAFLSWCELGMPAYSSYRLEISPIDDEVSDAMPGLVTQEFGDTRLSWFVC